MHPIHFWNNNLWRLYTGITPERLIMSATCPPTQFKPCGPPNSCPPMRFNLRTHMKDDCCEKTWADRANEQIASYWLNCDIPQCNIDPGYLCEPGLYQQEPLLLCNKAKADSDLRNGCTGNIITHTGSRQQLKVRPYRTVPYMGQCRAPLMQPDVYSQLISGEQTRTGKGCNTLSGITIDRFTPLVPCLRYNIQDPDHYIPKYWVRGGMDTRAYIRNIDYLRACGIKKCKTPCQQNFCRYQSLSPYDAAKRGQTRNMPCLPGGQPISY